MEDSIHVFLQYGAIGAICIYLIWRDVKMISSLEKTMLEVRDAIKKQVDQSGVLEKSLEHERNGVKTCYETVSKQLTEVLAHLVDIYEQSHKCETCVSNPKKTAPHTRNTRVTK